MPPHVTAVHQSAPALLVPVLLVLTLCCWPGQASLCERRCERAVPNLSNLRSLWLESFRYVNGRSISFEHFLLTVAREGGDAETIVLNIVARYTECMIACEHQSSKRSTTIQRPRPLRSRSRSKRLELFKRSQKRSWSNPELTVYLLRNRHFVKM